MKSSPSNTLRDARRYMRFRSIKSGLLRQDESSETIPVRVLDMSSAGARIELPAGSTPPATFALIVHPEDDLSRKTVNCRVVWQRDSCLGVSFL